jgi:hypothetical protein
MAVLEDPSMTTFDSARRGGALRRWAGLALLLLGLVLASGCGDKPAEKPSGKSPNENPTKRMPK